jgi:cyclin-dependent kinase regulatory subunit CKS1
MAESDYNRRNKVPRALSESEKARLDEFIDSIHYSARLVWPLHLVRN